MIDLDGLTVTMRDVRAAGMCSSGLRTFAARHGLDLTDFLRNGIEARRLAELDDALANKVLEVARGRQ